LLLKQVLSVSLCQRFEPGLRLGIFVIGYVQLMPVTGNFRLPNSVDVNLYNAS